jgi:hypothetical protein
VKDQDTLRKHMRWQQLTATIPEAEGFAERMGYHRLENDKKELPSDLLICKSGSARVVKVRQSWYGFLCHSSSAQGLISEMISST